MILRCKPLLGTFVEITIFQENSFAYLAVDEAFGEIEEIQNLMNFFDEKSQLSLLNNKAFELPIQVDERLFEVLKISENLFVQSKGLFDITLHRTNPDLNANAADIELLKNCCVKFNKPLKIDLSGIAKGYAVDRAALILENNGVFDYLINAGGDLKVGKLAQKISIKNPKKLGTSIYDTQISNCSLATSSGYFSYQEKLIDGVKTRIYPIFKSRNSCKQYDDESISVFAKNCVYSDALTKIVALKGAQSASILSYFQARAMMVDESNKIEFIN